MAANHTRIAERAMTRLKLRQLRLLIAVERHGTILGAAQALNISQPAATKMIKDLELDFEVPLFERTNRGAIPTLHGAALIRHGKLIFSQISNAAQELDDLTEGTSGRVTIGTLLAASAQLLPRAIEEVLHQRPNVTIKVIEGTNEVLMPGLRSGEIDLVVGRLPAIRHRRDLQQIALYDEEVQVLVGAGHPLARQPGLTLDDLRGHGWVLPPVETTLRRQIDQVFADMGPYAPPRVVESVSYLTNRALLCNLPLIGLMPRQVAAQDVAMGVLVPLDVTLPFGHGPVGVSYLGEDRLSPVGAVVLAALRSAASRIDHSISAVDSQG